MTAGMLDFSGIARWPWSPSNSTQQTFYAVKSEDDTPTATATLGRERSYTNRADVAFRLVELAVSSPYVQPQTLVRVITWLFNLPEGLQNPFVAVGDDGSISTEWDVGGSSLHVTFDDETEEVYFVSPDGEEWESTLDAVDKLSSAMRTIALATSPRR
jgi:hypothetical protein